VIIMELNDLLTRSGIDPAAVSTTEVRVNVKAIPDVADDQKRGPLWEGFRVPFGLLNRRTHRLSQLGGSPLCCALPVAFLLCNRRQGFRQLIGPPFRCHREMKSSGGIVSRSPPKTVDVGI